MQGPSRTSKSTRKTKSQPQGRLRGQQLLEKYNIFPVTVRPGPSNSQHPPDHATNDESVEPAMTTSVHAEYDDISLL